MVVATGFFDGVHIGHRLVIEQLVRAAAVRGDESMVVTFWPHPRNVLQKEARSLRLLTTLQEKKDRLLGLGVSNVEVLPFTKDFSSMTTEYYLRMLMDRYGARTVLIGYDNRMGHDALDADEVARVAEDMGLEVLRTEMVSSDAGYAVSSTKIREQLEAGNVETAAAMLGYAYSLKGVVVAGNRLGRTIGFPTANMQLYEPLKLIPGNGVYFVEVEVVGRRLYGMCNIGYIPTVSSGKVRTIETNIFGFDEEIYGLDMELTFIKKIRDEIRFDTLEELKMQLETDRNLCLEQSYLDMAGKASQGNYN
ncbi:MAG: riboflavin biosynthesis protein RibF [Bacteroidales bacterium]|nr:riboflavin biosynthesis protein RibF [Bacteroidales bacterium]